MSKISNFRVAVVALLALLTLPLIVAQAQTSQATWSVQYYNNLFLGDPPAFQTTVGEINFDWGNGSPNPAVQNDNWSARFGADVFFNEGTYRFNLRADDEVRLSIDERTVISTLDAGQPGNILTAEVALAGTHKLQIDYREITGAANLSLTWQDVRTVGLTLTPTLTATPVPSIPSGQTATVNAAVLNVRSEPSLNGAIIAKITRNQVFSVVGRNADSTWFQLDVNGQRGWASASFLTINDPNSAPVVGTPTATATPSPVTPTVPSGLTATVNAAVLNVRDEPSINGAILTKITRNQVYSVVGRNEESTWFQLDVNGQRGWASAAFLTVSDADSVTVVDTAPVETNPDDVLVRTSVRLNFRSGPATSFESLGIIPARTTLRVIGRNADSTWLRVEYDGQQGWVVLNFVQAVTDLNLGSIPVSE